MAKWGKCDFRQLKDFQKRMEQLQKKDFRAFCEAVAKELAARLLAKVIKLTPTGVKPDVGKEILDEHWAGYIGGTLKRGWTAKTEDQAKNGSGLPGAKEINEFLNNISIKNTGDEYEIEIINPVSYASYVEYGHIQKPGRFVPAIGKRLKSGWVKGKFMLTKSEIELEAQAPKILEKKLMKYLGECLDGE